MTQPVPAPTGPRPENALQVAPSAATRLQTGAPGGARSPRGGAELQHAPATWLQTDSSEPTSHDKSGAYDHAGAQPPGSRFPMDQVIAAAQLYYLDNATQAAIAKALGTSRPTVSRMLSYARQTGIVQITIAAPPRTDDIADRLMQRLGLKGVHLVPTARTTDLGTHLAPAVADALAYARLAAGDGLLVSSGVSVHAVAVAGLPALPGVVMTPIVGGQAEPEAQYQTNEIVRQMAIRCGGRPVFLHAPAMPGPELHDVLLRDPDIQQVIDLWHTAKAAIIGVGAPPETRTSLPSVLPRDPHSLRTAVGDIAARPYDVTGAPLTFEGSERLMAIRLDELRDIPVTIAVAVGRAKVAGLLAAARAGYYTNLATDIDTALHLLDAASPTAPH